MSYHLSIAVTLGVLLMSKYFTRKRNDTRTYRQRMRDDLTKFRYGYKHVSKEVRLKWLIKLANKVYISIPKEQLEARREKFKKKLKYDTVVRYNGITVKCKLCEEKDAQNRHHIIQMQHGGHNRGRNLFALCDDCHKLIHPWLN